MALYTVEDILTQLINESKPKHFCTWQRIESDGMWQSVCSYPKWAKKPKDNKCPACEKKIRLKYVK